MGAALHGVRWPPDPARGARRPSPLRQQPRVSLGTACRRVTHDRTVARLSIAWTRQVTVTDLICGVDVCSAALDVRLGRDGAIAALCQRRPTASPSWPHSANEHQVGLVALEATGGYERLPLPCCGAPALPAAIVNPRAVRRFAEAMGFLEKTDRIDSGIIAWYAEVKRIVPPPAGRRGPAAACRAGHPAAPAHRTAHRPEQPAPPGHRARRRSARLPSCSPHRPPDRHFESRSPS